MTDQTKRLFVGWYDPSDNFWYPIGQICTTETGYQFEYLCGALRAQAKAGFRGIFQFPDFNIAYESDELFAFFRNRLLTSSRDNFDEEITRLGLENLAEGLLPFDVLSRTNGRRATDTFEVYPAPTVQGDTAQLVFFARGVRYLPDELKRRWEKDRPRQPFRLQWERDNQYDEHALQIIDSDDRRLGYLLRYYSESFHRLLEYPCDYELELVRHNRQPGFVRERFLMQLTSDTFDDWRFPQSDLYDAISDESAGVATVA